MTFDHLYFANIEEQNSPMGRSGYQIYRTSNPDLNRWEASIARSLGRLSEQCHSKSVFFQLGEHFAVARITRDLRTDAHGRTGMFFSHVILPKREQLLSLGNDPFRLLDSDRLWHHPAASIRLSDPPPDYLLHPLEGEVQVSTRACRSPIDNKLLAGALRAADLKKDKSTICLIGTEEEIEDVLRTLFQKLPTNIRAECTFDTLEAAGAGVGEYWAVGASNPRPDLRLSPSLDLARQQWLTDCFTSMSDIENRIIGFIQGDTGSSREAATFLDWMWDSNTPADLSILNTNTFTLISVRQRSEAVRFTLDGLLGRSSDELGRKLGESGFIEKLEQLITRATDSEPRLDKIKRELHVALKFALRDSSAQLKNEISSIATDLGFKDIAFRVLLEEGKGARAYALADHEERESLLKTVIARLTERVDRKVLVTEHRLSLTYELLLPADCSGELAYLLAYLGGAEVHRGFLGRPKPTDVPANLLDTIVTTIIGGAG